MEYKPDITEFPEGTEKNGQLGYTFLELLAVMALAVILVLATQGMMRNHKRFAIEETCVQRLNEIARLENIYRYSNDPTVNPEGTYGSFFELQNAGLIPDLFEEDDEKRHTVNAYVPHYILQIQRNHDDDESEPDAYNFFVVATPTRNNLGLKTFYMQEDGEVYWWWKMRPLEYQLR